MGAVLLICRCALYPSSCLGYLAVVQIRHANDAPGPSSSQFVSLASGDLKKPISYSAKSHRFPSIDLLFLSVSVSPNIAILIDIKL